MSMDSALVCYRLIEPGKDCLRSRLPNRHEPSPPHSGLSMTQIVEARDLRARFTGGEPPMP
jgi:hypothetical protein